MHGTSVGPPAESDTSGRTWQISVASGLNALAGLWLIIAPFLLGYSVLSQPLWNDVIIGIAVAMTAAFGAFGAYRASWLSWLDAVFGLWLVTAPFILGYRAPQAIWNDVLVGIVVIALAIWSALASSPRTIVTAPDRY